jgi:hypothetical protein
MIQSIEFITLATPVWADRVQIECYGVSQIPSAANEGLVWRTLASPAQCPGICWRAAISLRVASRKSSRWHWYWRSVSCHLTSDAFWGLNFAAEGEHSWCEALHVRTLAGRDDQPYKACRCRANPSCHIVIITQSLQPTQFYWHVLSNLHPYAQRFIIIPRSAASWCGQTCTIMKFKTENRIASK